MKILQPSWSFFGATTCCFAFVVADLVAQRVQLLWRHWLFICPEGALDVQSRVRDSSDTGKEYGCS